MLKFALHFLADATLAVGLTALAAGAAPLPAPVLLLFAAGSLWVEAGQLARAEGGGDEGKDGGRNPVLHVPGDLQRPSVHAQE